jgi:hypothetical protein
MLPSVRKPKPYRDTGTALIRCEIATLRMAALRHGQRRGCYEFPCDALVHRQARAEMERNRAQAPRRGTYLPDQRGSRFSRNACLLICADETTCGRFAFKPNPT